MLRTWISIFCSLITVTVFATGKPVSLQARIVDRDTHQGLEFTSVSLRDSLNKNDYFVLTDENGQFQMKGITPGNYRLSISYLGYRKKEETIRLDKDIFLEIRLEPDQSTLDAVVVTASESKKMTASSRIDLKAMEHLQPSSFTDLLELLPGGMSKDPKLNQANLIKLREVGSSDSKYDISSLGTSFVVDGVPLATAAEMQYLSGNGSMAQMTAGKGVDMRTIPTDHIESVEIVRGVPSVEYGDLTSGLVQINRKKGKSPWEARFKADGFSKLIYLGKGFRIEDKALDINAGIDFLNAQQDPRDPYVNYKRLTASIRTGKLYNKDGYNLKWSTSLDYTGSFDNEKSDPEISISPDDYFKSNYNKTGLSNKLEWEMKDSRFFKSLMINGSVNYQVDRLEQRQFIQVNRASFIPEGDLTGEHDAIFLPGKYTADLLVDGKPLDIFLKAMGRFNLKTGNILNDIKLGSDWKFDKNYGDGQVYDPSRPPMQQIKSRPRAYKDIPAGQILSFFAEDAVGIPIGRHLLKALGGIRTQSLLGLEPEFKMSNRIYFDPRFNAQWVFPGFHIFGKKAELALNGAIGWHTKFPVLLQLYPDPLYYDYVQLNYYHTNPEYRRVNIMTYRNDRNNYGLTPARNKKWEVGLDFTVNQNRVNITYFRESLSSGFRPQTLWNQYTYKKYDYSGIDPGSLTGPPSLEYLPYKTDTILQTYGSTNNGTELLKEGIEYQFASRRIPALKTRITINGAWFKTTYRNSFPIAKQTSMVIQGKELHYIGIYASDEGYVKEQFNTNCLFDTYIPEIGFEFSTSVQCMWFTSNQQKQKPQIPFAYVDTDGKIYPYTETEMKDPELQWLNLSQNTYLLEDRVPLALQVNFKASKDFRNKIRLSVFVNNLLDYLPDYTSTNGALIRRYVNPYFGMEINFKL